MCIYCFFYDYFILFPKKMLYLYREIMLILKGNYLYIKTLRVVDKIKLHVFD